MRTRNVWLLSGFLAAVILLALGAGPVGFALRIYAQSTLPSVPLPDRPLPASQAQADRQDFDDLEQLLRLDRSFSDDARAEFQHGLTQLRARAGTMTDAEFAMGVARLVALAGNGHTTVDTAERAAKFGLAPVRFAWFADGLYIVRATAEMRELLGTRVISIDERPVEDAAAAVRPYISGTLERARANSAPLLESPALLQAIWQDTDGAHLVLRLETKSGEILTRVLTALPAGPDPVAGQPILAMIPGVPDQGGAQWISVLKNDRNLPLSLRDPDPVVYSAALDKNGLYVRLNGVVDDDLGPMDAQLATVLRGAPAAGWRWLVLDLRFNDGGDQTKIDAFTRALPKVLAKDGGVWVLTGNATFSAGIITLARAKHFVGDRLHIVGETVADSGHFWAEGGAPLLLRNSKIEIRYASFLHDWIDGCYSISRCFPINLLDGVAAGDLSPDIAVGWKFADYAAGKDTLLETVRTLAVTR